MNHLWRKTRTRTRTRKINLDRNVDKINLDRNVDKILSKKFKPLIIWCKSGAELVSTNIIQCLLIYILLSIFPFIVWFLSALNWFRIKVLHICEFVEQWFDTCRVCKIWSQAWNNETILHCIESTFNTVQYTPNIKDFGCQRLTILHERPKPFF